MSLEGRLEDANLLEIVRLLHSSAKEGKLTLQSEDKIGFVVFQTGEIISAKLGSLLGEDAIYQMTLWEQGSFRFDPERVEQARAILLNHTNLMIEAARRFSEWKTISKKIPSLEMVPEFVPQTNPETPQVSLSTNEWVLLSKVDGHRNIRAISDGSKFGVFETCKIFYGLISSGLLRVRAPAEAAAAVQKPAAAQSQGRPGSKAPPAAPTFGVAQTQQTTAGGSRAIDLKGAAQALQAVGEKYLGSFASSIIEKSLRKAKVDLGDLDTDRQVFALKRCVDFIQRASSTILGPELAAQMAAEIDAEIEQRVRA
jgi:uncharacterized protein DUF4388